MGKVQTAKILLKRMALVGFATVGLANSTSSSPSPSVIVITSDERPVNVASVPNVHITVFNLDDVRTIEDQLGKGLPADKQLAKAIVQQRIAEIGQPQLNESIRSAYQGISLAMRYGIDRYPAIVIDGRVIVYGVVNVATALAYYEQWQQSQVSPP